MPNTAVAWIRNSIPPCKGCEKREPGCHGKCEDYISWSDQNYKEKKAKTQYLFHNDRSRNYVGAKTCNINMMYGYGDERAKLKNSRYKKTKGPYL